MDAERPGSWPGKINSQPVQTDPTAGETDESSIQFTGRNSRIVIHRKIAWLLLFSVFSLGFVSWLVYTSNKNIQRTHAAIDRTYEISTLLRDIHTMLVAAGSDSWQYQARPDSVVVARLRTTQSLLTAGVDSLIRLTAVNHDQQANIQLLRRYLQERQGLVPGQDQAFSERAKTLLGRMVREEEELLKLRKLQDQRADNRTAVALIIGRSLGFLFVVVLLLQLNQDIGRRKATQERLVAAMREAQSARQLQEQFLANMSHEIRTPMNGIKGMTDLLLGTPLSEKQHELAAIIKHSANNLLVIVNDILDFSKIKAGKLRIEQIDFNLREVLQRASAIFEHRVRAKGLGFQMTIDPAIPASLHGDPHRLNQVLINLIGNAVKFTARGRIGCRVQLRERAAGRVILAFTITDTGIGISPAELPHVFDNFSQAGQDIARRYGGTGLGLTICKQLLQLQGGDITVNSSYGKGTEFHFYIPYAVGARQEPATAGGTEIPASGEGVEVIAEPDKEAMDGELVGQTEEWGGEKQLAGRHFLVAEDNEINQKLIGYVLQKAGGKVVLAHNGAEALDRLREGKRFDLIIMDLQMPEMDGYEATRCIRQELQLRTPIIAMTATAMKGEEEQCMEAGMNEYMTKPFEFDDLYKRIGQLLR